MSAYPRDALSIHRFLMRSGVALGHVFAWVFLLQYFFLQSNDLRVAFINVIFLYVIVQDIVILTTPLFARLVHNGVRYSMTWGVVALCAAYVSLAGVFFGAIHEYQSFAILAFVLCLGIYRALYWVPYHVEVERTVHTPLSRTAYEIFIAILPALAGVLVSKGFVTAGGVLLCATVFSIASLIPLSSVPEVYERFSWQYRETFHHLFDGRNARLALASIGDGIQGAALLLFWPLAIILIVGWSYGLLGLILSVTFLISYLVRDAFHSFFRRFGVERSEYVHAAIAASAWILRLVASSPIGVVIVDSYFYTGAPIRISTTDPHVFEQTADRGSYVDEYTALKEVGLATGRIIVCGIMTVLLSFFSVPSALLGVFLTAAFAAACTVFLVRFGRPAY